MEILKSIILGIIQGLTEFLPVSSSGHLVLAKYYLNMQVDSNVAFEVFLHLGSVLAVIIYFRKDIIELLTSLIKFKEKDKRNVNNRETVFYLIIATFITGLAYFFFDDKVEALFDTHNTNNILIVSILLSVTGLIVFLSDKVSISKMNEKLGIKKSILIGIAQSFALLPGISRSGSTIAMGIFVGMKRESVARFSFLLSLPAILGASLVKFDEFLDLSQSEFISYLAGAIAAFISGYLVIATLIKLIQNKNLKIFSFYCWAISIISVVLYLIK